MIQDIESVHDMITAQAIEHIHSNDVILTYGRSNILNSFFEVISSAIMIHTGSGKGHLLRSIGM